MLWAALSLYFMPALKTQGVNKYSLKMRPKQLLSELWCVREESPLLFLGVPCWGTGLWCIPRKVPVWV